MGLKDKLLEIIDAKRAIWSREDLELATRVGEDLAMLFARKLAGEKVVGELALAEASAKNIAAAAAVTGAQALREALGALLGEILNRVSPV